MLKSESISILTYLILIATNANGDPCQLRSYGVDKFVCVCNATYCDDLQRVPITSLNQFVTYTSTASGNRFISSQGSFTKLCSAIQTLNGVDGRITINSNQKLQKIIGFGGAFTDSAGYNIKNLPIGAQKNVIDSYFGPSGIHYTIGRVPMGGADFSLRGYTYDDVADDVKLANFKLQDEDMNYKIPFIKDAMTVSPYPIKLFGSSWSSPPWTKTNNDYKGMGWLKTEYWQYWADYFVKFLEAYKSNGIEFWAVTTQNEPSTGFVPAYPFNALAWTAEWMLNWVIDHLGPTLKEKFPQTNIIVFDDNSLFLEGWADTILSNKTAADYISGVGFHWYSNSITGYGPIGNVHTKYPNYFLLSTEACTGFLPTELPKVDLGSWDRAQQYANDILQGLAHGSGGWVDWNMALDMNGKPNWAGLAADSPIIVNATGQEFYKQPMFYAMGHASGFFMPDADVISSSVKTSLLKSILCADCVMAQAVLNPDGSVAVYILNKGTADVNYIIQDDNHGCIKLKLQGKSFTTLTYQQ